MRTSSVAVLGAAILLLPASVSHAAPVTPLLDTSLVDRVHELVPLGADGSRIAFVATEAGSKFLRNEVVIANADATGVRRVDTGDDSSAGSTQLAATDDGRWIFWVSGGNAENAWLASTETAKRVRIKGYRHPEGSTFSPEQVVGAQSRFFGLFLNGRVLRMLKPGSTDFTTIPVRGGLPGTRVTAQAFRRSDHGDGIGSCANVQLASGRRGVRLGLLDRQAAMVKVRVVSTGAMATNFNPRNSGVSPTCGVSDDGTTVATIIRRGPARHVLTALRAGRVVRVPVPATSTLVGSVSPDGRRVLVADSAFDDLLGVKLAVADLDTGKVVKLTNVGRYARRAAGAAAFLYGRRTLWSRDSAWLALAPASGGLLTAQSQEDMVRYRRPPEPPVGFAFSKPVLVTPQEFASEGRLVFSYPDQSNDVTVFHPYVAAADGSGSAAYLLSRSMNSFEGIVRSRDGSAGWLLPSATCRSYFRYPLMRAQLDQLWASPFEAREYLQ